MIGRTWAGFTHVWTPHAYISNWRPRGAVSPDAISHPAFRPEITSPSRRICGYPDPFTDPVHIQHRPRSGRSFATGPSVSTWAKNLSTNGRAITGEK